MSRLCQQVDERVDAYLDRPIEGDWPYLWIDVTYVKVRRAGRIVSVAVIVAVGANSDGRREVLGMTVGSSGAEVFSTDFLGAFLDLPRGATTDGVVTSAEGCVRDGAGPNGADLWL